MRGLKSIYLNKRFYQRGKLKIKSVFCCLKYYTAAADTNGAFCALFFRARSDLPSENNLKLQIEKHNTADNRGQKYLSADKIKQATKIRLKTMPQKRLYIDKINNKE